MVKILKNIVALRNVQGPQSMINFEIEVGQKMYVGINTISSSFLILPLRIVVEKIKGKLYL